MNTPISARLACLAAAVVITFTTVQAIASYALPQPAAPVLASACLCG
jgi:hypothetical protein